MTIILFAIAAIIVWESYAHQDVGFPDSLDPHWDGHEYPEGHLHFGIKVPFYLYSGEGFDVFRKNCNPIIWSKGVEVSWLHRLERHPWRVKKANDAIYFVVPALFSLAVYDDGQHCRLPVDDMAATLLKALHASKHFKRNGGRDHIMLVSYFKGQQYLSQHSEWQTAVGNMTLALHVASKHYLHIPEEYGEPCRVPVGHQPSKNLPVLDGEPPAVAQRTFFFLGQAVGASYYGVRRAALARGAMETVGTNNFLVASDCAHKNVSGPYPICGSDAVTHLVSSSVGCCLEQPMVYADYMKEMVHSNFSLNMRGGDSGSSRTYDAIVAGTPQVVVSDGFIWNYAAFTCTVPWSKFVHFVKEKPFLRNTHVIAKEALATLLPRREEMKKLQDAHRDDLLWTSARSLSANNLLVQAAKRCLNGNRVKMRNVMTRKILVQVKRTKCV